MSHPDTLALPAAAPPPAAQEPEPQAKPVSTLVKIGFVLLAFGIGSIIITAVVISSLDLYEWARDPKHLDAPHGIALMFPLVLDVAAIVCIIVHIVSAIWRREKAGLFGVVVWVLCGISVFAQYRLGIAVRDAGGAQDRWWAFPVVAIIGPALLEMTLAKIRKWLRKDSQEILDGAAGFGIRWMPFIAFRETAQAWTASRREGISKAPDAIAFVRARKAIRNLSDVDALRYAFGHLKTTDAHEARVWLQRLGREVPQSAIDAAGDVEQAIVARKREVAVLEQRARELEEHLASRKNEVDRQLAAAQEELERVRAEAEVQPSLDEIAAEVSKTAAIHVAHSALATASYASVVAFLRERGVEVSDTLVKKARAQAEQMATDALLKALEGRPKVIDLNQQRRTIDAQ